LVVGVLVLLVGLLLLLRVGRNRGTRAYRWRMALWRTALGLAGGTFLFLGALGLISCRDSGKGEQPSTKEARREAASKAAAAEHQRAIESAEAAREGLRRRQMELTGSEEPEEPEVSCYLMDDPEPLTGTFLPAEYAPDPEESGYMAAPLPAGTPVSVDRSASPPSGSLFQPGVVPVPTAGPSSLPEVKPLSVAVQAQPRTEAPGSTARRSYASPSWADTHEGFRLPAVGDMRSNVREQLAREAEAMREREGEFVSCYLAEGPGFPVPGGPGELVIPAADQGDGVIRGPRNVDYDSDHHAEPVDQWKHTVDLKPISTAKGGKIDLGQLNRYLRLRSSAFQKCGVVAARKTGKLAGEVVFDLEIGLDGRVVSEVKKDTTGNAAAGECVAERMAGWSFPKPADSPARVQLRMQFKAEKTEDRKE
jgi:hypothetical protein